MLSRDTELRWASEPKQTALQSAARAAHLHGAGRIFHAVQMIGEVMRFQRLHDFLAQLVLADGADGDGLMTELRGMIGEVGRCPAQFLSFGKHVPKRFPDSYNEFFIHRHHIYYRASLCAT